MRIAHLVSTFPPYFGGMGNAAFAMARESAKRGHAVTVLTPKVENSGKDFPFTVHFLQSFGRYGNAAFLPQIFWLLDNYDIIHLHYPFFGGAEIAALWKMSQLQSKRQLVVTYHMDATSDGWLGRLFAWHNRFCLPWILRAADRVIVTSFDYAEHGELKKYEPNIKHKLVEIPLGVDTERFFPKEKDRELLRQHKIDLESFTVLFVGALDHAHAFKGVDVLLRAFKLLCEFHTNDGAAPRLVIVGDGNSRPSYAALARELAIQDNVVFVGRVSSDDLPRYYHIADTVVLPSISASEAFGMVLLEGMASGRAVVASNLPGVRKVIVDKRTGVLVKPGDVVGLAKAIEALAHDPTLCARYGKEGRARVLDRYTWGQVGEELERIYR